MRVCNNSVFVKQPILRFSSISKCLVVLTPVVRANKAIAIASVGGLPLQQLRVSYNLAHGCAFRQIQYAIGHVLDLSRPVASNSIEASNTRLLGIFFHNQALFRLVVTSTSFQKSLMHAAVGLKCCSSALTGR